MSRKGRRVRIARGVYEDATGLSAIACHGQQQREKRFPLGTALRKIQAWQKQTVGKLAEKAPRTTAARGTFAADAKSYLKQIQYLASWKERASELQAWLVHFGPRHRSHITPAAVRRVMSEWSRTRRPKTINNRLQTLRNMYRVLDSTKDSPFDDILLLGVTKTPAVAIPPPLVRVVAIRLEERERAGLLRDSRTRARFMVIASTGRRPSEIMRAEPSDVDLERRVWTVRDGKGGFSAGLYLNRDMLAAWRLFIEAEAWGQYETSSFARVLRSAGWPAGVRPYNLRHSVGIALSEQGEDLADVQHWMGHTKPETTRKHYVPVLNSRLQKASQKLDGRLGWGKSPGTHDLALDGMPD